MAHIDPHRIDDLAARRLGRRAQVAALPPQPLRPPQTLWQLHRRAWMHGFRGPRQVGSFGPETHAAQIARLMLLRRGLAPDLALQVGETLAGIPTGEWSLELLRDILPPAQEEVIPEILSAATIPAGLTALQWAQLTSPLGGLGEPGALIAGGVAQVGLLVRLSLAVGQAARDRRQSIIPAPAHLKGLSAFVTGPQMPRGTLWIGIAEIGYYHPIDVENGFLLGSQIQWPLEIDITAPATLECGYDIVNTGAVPLENTYEIIASVSYQPVTNG